MTGDGKQKGCLGASNRQQIEEALGNDNKYFAGLHYGYEVTDPEMLLLYYIDHGGACGHRQRLAERDAQPPPD